MGCCESKAKQPKEVPKAPTVKSEKPPTTVKNPTVSSAKPTPREEPVEEPPEEPPVDERAERLQAIDVLHQKQFNRYNACGVEEGETTPLFTEGLVFRIVKGEGWYIYNDTLTYEAHVDYRFGPNSKLTAGEDTTLEATADGWLRAETVVYPLETKLLATGVVDGYKSGVTVLPLSVEYRQREVAETHAVLAQELEDVENLADGQTDEEEVLRRCVAHNTPYVDVNFKPSAMLSRSGVDTRQLGPFAVQRPTQYLSEEDVSAGVQTFCGPIVPQVVDEGYLGDSWLTSSAAILAEREDAVRDVFAEGSDAEKRVGAYRVSVCKQGWWRSVIVDNYVPTVTHHPVFACSTDRPREMWVPMLQKAYAKVHGSYASVTGGDALQALQDLTGAPTYRFDKEWAEAVQNPSKATTFLLKLSQYIEKGYLLIVNTPSQNSTSYLGKRYGNNADEMKETYERVGLRLGRTYAVARVDAGGDDVYFKIRNPWYDQEKLSKQWVHAGDDEAITEAVSETAKEGFVWVKWTEALNYFDGGGVVYHKEGPSVDYRVKGAFIDVQPSAVLEIVAAEPVEVMLVLSQPDKRGVPTTDPNLRYSPIMLSVSHASDGRQRVEKNSAWDPEAPAEEYNFMVTRDVALTYTFRPENGTHLVIPRIHRKGVAEGYDRPYTIGIISSEDLDSKLRVTVKQIDKDSRVFKNIVTFPDDARSTVEAETQVHHRGGVPVSSVSSLVVGAAVASKPQSSRHGSSVQGSEEVASQEEEEQPKAHESEEQQLEHQEAPQEVEEHEMTPVTEEAAPARHDSDSDSAGHPSPKQDSPPPKSSSRHSSPPAEPQVEEEEKQEEAPVAQEEKKEVEETRGPSAGRFNTLKVKDSDEDSDVREL